MSRDNLREIIGEYVHVHVCTQTLVIKTLVIKTLVIKTLVIKTLQMRDEKEERKKQARSNKQTRQSNTAHPRQSLFMYMYMLGVLCCFALFVCLTLLASFFLPSHLSFKNMYMHVHCTCGGNSTVVLSYCCCIGNTCHTYYCC